MSTEKPAKLTAQKKARGAYHHGDLKRALLDAALALVLERGPAGFSLAEICRSAGVSQAAPYRHYESKEHLLGEAAAEGFHTLIERLDAVFAGCDDLFVAIEQMTKAYLRFARDYPAHMAVMFDSRIGQVFQGAIECAQAAGPEGVQALPPPTNRTEEAIMESWRVGQQSYLRVLDGLSRLAPGTRLERVIAEEGGRRFASALWAIIHGVAVLGQEHMIQAEWNEDDGQQVYEWIIRPWCIGLAALGSGDSG